MTTLIAVFNAEGKCVQRCDAKCYDAQDALSVIPSQIQPFDFHYINNPLSHLHFNVDFFYTIGRVGVTIFEMVRRTDTWPLLIVVLLLVAAFNVLFTWLNKTDELE